MWLPQARVNEAVGQSLVKYPNIQSKYKRNPSKVEYHARDTKLHEVLKNDMKEPFNSTQKPLTD